jgi:hypothetical protein
MAFSGFSASNHLSVDEAAVTAAPLTMACWFRSNSITVNQNLIAINRISSNADYFGLAANGAEFGDPVQAYINGGNAGVVKAVTSTGFSASIWTHACAVFSSSTDRSAFINGGSKGTSSTSRTPASLGRTSIGVFKSFSAVDALNGAIAEIGIWGAALSDAEVASLARGFSPSLVRPQSLISYWPLIRHNINIRGGIALGAVGSLSVLNHPRIYK